MSTGDVPQPSSSDRPKIDEPPRSVRSPISPRSVYFTTIVSALGCVVIVALVVIVLMHHH